MTCLECSNALSEGTSTCSFCGAPVESVVEQKSEAEQVGASVTALLKKALPPAQQTSSAELRLWSPLVIALLFIPVLGMWVSTGMLALNWRALGKKNWQTWTWLFLVVPFILAVVLPTDISVNKSILVNFAVWLPLMAFPQIWYLRSYFATGYNQRGWIVPVGIGIIVSFLLPKAIDGFNTSFGPADRAVSSELSETSLQAKPTPDLTVEQVVEQKSGNVFPVEVSYTESSYLIFSSNKKKYGSAVRIGASGNSIIFLTNKHVVQVPSGASNVKRVVGSNQPTPFEIISEGADDVDLVMFKVIVPQAFEEVWIYGAELSKLSVGEECVAIGNTLGAGISVTTGIISKFDNGPRYTLIRTSAPISPGNSGGALFRRKDGALIGITTKTLTGDGAQAVNFALPMDCIDLLQPVSH